MSGSGEEQPTIGWITGKDYTSSAKHRNTRRPLLPCPWPNGFGFEENVGQCAYIFSRAYDLRRHLKTDHALELSKEEIDHWAQDWRERHPNPN